MASTGALCSCKPRQQAACASGIFINAATVRSKLLHKEKFTGDVPVECDERSDGWGGGFVVLCSWLGERAAALGDAAPSLFGFLTLVAWNST